MVELFKEIGALIDNRNASQFKIMGYCHLDVIVKLVYDDCDEYFIAKYSQKNDGSFSPLERVGFSFDRPYLGEVESWVKEWDKLEKETKNIESC